LRYGTASPGRYSVLVQAGKPVTLTEVLRGFSQFLQANVEIPPGLGHDRFLSVHHSSIIDHLSFDSVVQQLIER
jgi:hypothetical protein